MCLEIDYPSPDRRENPWHWEIATQARNDKIGMIAGSASKKNATLYNVWHLASCSVAVLHLLSLKNFAFF
jgi:hypothetical protein